MNLRETIRRTLAQRIGDALDSRTTVDAVLATWQQVAARLAPVIGVRGTEALFGRALHLTSTTFLWLAIAEDRGNRAPSLERFRSCLAARDPATAVAGSLALLVTFTELLAALIGEDLTERLLAPVWTAPSAPSEPETEP